MKQTHLLKVIIVLLAIAIGLTLVLWPKKPVQDAQAMNKDTINANERKRYDSHKNDVYHIVDDSLDVVYQRERAKYKP